MQKFNYHTHVERCRHAIGNEEEMVLAAIEAGFEVIGLSDHLPFKDIEDEGVRMCKCEIDEYIQEANRVKEKYKNQIKVLVGFEAEYFEDCVEYLKEIKSKCDYLILGQHYFKRGLREYCDEPYTSSKYIEAMANQICEAIEQGLIQYIAHIDYFLLNGSELTSKHLEAIRKVAKCAKHHDCVLEINLKGTRFQKMEYDGNLSWRYPNTLVFKTIAEVGCKVCFGYDAHSPQALKAREIENVVRNEFESLHLNYVDDPFIK